MLYDETSKLIGVIQVDNNTLKTTGDIDQSLIQYFFLSNKSQKMEIVVIFLKFSVTFFTNPEWSMGILYASNC